MKWEDHHTHVEIALPADFSFQECLRFLGRSDQELVYTINEGHLYKLLKIDTAFILCDITHKENVLHVQFSNEVPTFAVKQEVVSFISEWLDLDRDLTAFYHLASQDEILHKLVVRYQGLRMIRIPDLFEALTWAIIGQQVNLTFAYKLKKRLTEMYGEHRTFRDKRYWLFPDPASIAELTVDELRGLQLSRRKAEYIIYVAALIRDGQLTKAELGKRMYDSVKKSLVAIRGIGNWTADYVLMKCLGRSEAFPIADVGLHNAIKVQLGLHKKPALKQIEMMATKWEGWQAYATFYLWRSLYDEQV
ncbi:DNA-3-methyladenine glycosylase family protein [Virgibacillus salexigens]|uniref:DNA-3-methyladenine glycosylase family protein n=1 Tax=Virgibacillus salexigens TaxID=61016 RepID=UPI00190972FA|nr:DNA-3-methyladenine glycosylase [Virgibacillus salexigens]